MSEPTVPNGSSNKDKERIENSIGDIVVVGVECNVIDNIKSKSTEKDDNNPNDSTGDDTTSSGKPNGQTSGVIETGNIVRINGGEIVAYLTTEGLNSQKKLNTKSKAADKSKNVDEAQKE